MAGAPRFKVHDSAGVYQASCKEIEAAACLLGFYAGGSIKDGGRIVYKDGRDGNPAESYDQVAHLVNARNRWRSWQRVTTAPYYTDEDVQRFFPNGAPINPDAQGVAS